jgi:serine protease Do
MTGRTDPVRLLFLLFLLGLSLYAYVNTPIPPRPQQVPHFVHHEITPPSGALASTFEKARPATLQIEVHHSLRPPSIQGIGTGFFISPDGLVLTAYHVISPRGLGSPSLRFYGVGPDEKRYPLELVGFDAYLDLALLQAKVRDDVPFIPLAAAAPRVGSEVVAIGNSLGDFLEGRAGRVTALGMEAPRADFASGTIQLSAVLYPGDSGGPVLNTKGEALGVVSYISYGPDVDDDVSPPFWQRLNTRNEFASYAIPVTRSSSVIAELRQGGQRDEPVVGFSARGDYFGGGDLGPAPGVIVNSVRPNGPAERAGIRNYTERSLLGEDGELILEVTADVIIAVDGKPTREFYELLGIIRSYNIGDTVTLTLQRGDEAVDVQLELGAKRAVFN